MTPTPPVAVEKKAVATLPENVRSFIVPSYQRGYRWGEVQVRQLVEDLREAAENGKPYCLQPLVVHGDKNTKEWRVIDGQQRLTTLWLLLDALGKRPSWQLCYERHGGVTKPLDIPEGTPDAFFVTHARQALSESPGLEAYLDDPNGPFFLWYEPEGKESDIFARLNAGKIHLSNAELIKAALLDRQADVNARQWDAVEQRLQDEDFWCFVNPEPDAARFSAARIDFLFELWMRRGGNGKSDDFAKNPEQAFRRNPFVVYEAVVGTKEAPNDTKAVWQEVCEISDKMNEWYDDPWLYHLIGFLMANRVKKPEERFRTLLELLAKVTPKKAGQAEEPLTKHGFVQEVRERCRQAIFGDREIEACLGGWVYGKNNKEIIAALLLFNLALTHHAGLERTRFPFGTFRGTGWSIEHIHPHARGGSDAFGNLTLLPKGDNAAFSDGIFHEKRSCFRKWLGVDGTDGPSDGPKGFIPLGTRLVFARFVGREAPEETSGDWDAEKDGGPYQAFVAKTIETYLPNGK